MDSQLVHDYRPGALASDVIAKLDAALPSEWSGSIARIVMSLAVCLRGGEAWDVPKLAGADAFHLEYWSIVRETRRSGMTEHGSLIGISNGPLLDWAIDRARSSP